MDHDLNLTALAVTSACIIVWGLRSRAASNAGTCPPLDRLRRLRASSSRTVRPRLVHFTLQSSTIRSLAEVTLAVVLFADASRVNLRALARRGGDPGAPSSPSGSRCPSPPAPPPRRPSSGNSGLWVAAAIGAIVRTDPDAALGASIMEDERGASRRCAAPWNVESGLNDGIATPFINLFIAGSRDGPTPSVGTHLTSRR